MERIVGTGGDEYAPVIEGERLGEVLDVKGAPEARYLRPERRLAGFFPRFAAGRGFEAVLRASRSSTRF